jgi:predicted nucleotidyltransferase
MIETMLISAPHSKIRLAVLHGSRTTGSERADSDWDVAVLADHALTGEDRSMLRTAFAAKLSVPEDRVDISDLRSDAPLLRYRVAMHGTPIEGDSREFRAFQLRAWKDYLNNRKMSELRSALVSKQLS